MRPPQALRLISGARPLIQIAGKSSLLPPKVVSAETTSTITSPEGLDFTVVYLDEVPMPQRPTMPPTMHDREVFVDPFPGEEGSPEMVDWLETFGDLCAA